MRQNVYEYSFAMQKERNSKIARTFFVIVGVILFISLFLNFILFPCLVRSDSMESDIAKNSAVFVTPLDKNPNRGDVFFIAPQEENNLAFYKVFLNKFVAFFTFQQFEPFSYSKKSTERSSLRRVIGLPGDKIYIQDYIAYVKPQEEKFFLTEFELSSRPYNIHIYSVPAEWDGLGVLENMKEIELGADEYFVLADNRIEATDSRVYGTVCKNRIKGRALLEYFPFNKIRIF